MKHCLLSLIIFCSIIQFTWALVEENYVDFTISPSTLISGDIHFGVEWLTSSEFAKRSMSVVDGVGVAQINPERNHLIATKVAFISKRSFNDLSHSKMNDANFISQMLNAQNIKKIGIENWSLTNKVKAYGIPFNVNFSLKFTEVSPSLMQNRIGQFLKDEGTAIKRSARERFYILDMSQFDQLIYRNYSYVYMKEIGPKETLIVSIIVTGFDLKTANRFFNYPPLSTTKGTMMKNMKNQIIHMANMLQD